VFVKAVPLSSAACTSPGYAREMMRLWAPSREPMRLWAPSREMLRLWTQSRRSGHSRLLSAFAQTHTVYARTHTQTHIPLWIEIRIDFRTKIGPQVFLFFSSFPPLCPHSDHCLLMHFRLQKDGIRLPDERHMPVQLHALRALHFFEREPELLRLQ
jgi:hypothetical protein